MMELTLFHTLEWCQQAFRNTVIDVIQDSKTIGDNLLLRILTHCVKSVLHIFDVAFSSCFT